ncbi:MAG: hypothetical protein OXI43_15950 [Candidatus Poribacteria bacterium]|nr:hypothetical protein [Candidatus Poribacteria bacterium]
MFIGNLKRGFFARLITLCLAITLTIGLLFIGTNTLIGDETNDLHAQKSDALETLRELTPGEKREIAWGYVGAYRSAPGKTNARTAFWWNDLDDFLSKAPDAEIVNLATIFTDPTVVAVLRQLIEGKKSIEDLAKESDIPKNEIEKAVMSLIDSQLAARTEENLIEPKNDAGSFFLNFVSMTIVHSGHTDSKDR